MSRASFRRSRTGGNATGCQNSWRSIARTPGATAWIALHLPTWEEQRAFFRRRRVLLLRDLLFGAQGLYWIEANGAEHRRQSGQERRGQQCQGRQCQYGELGRIHLIEQRFDISLCR
jgi:hypothetical protein